MGIVLTETSVSWPELKQYKDRDEEMWLQTPLRDTWALPPKSTLKPKTPSSPSYTFSPHK